jgi:hypothetical protein
MTERKGLPKELVPLYLDAVQRDLQSRLPAPKKWKTVEFHVLTNSGIFYNGIYVDINGSSYPVGTVPDNSFTGKKIKVKIADPLTNFRSLSINPHERKYINDALKRAKLIVVNINKKPSRKKQ